MTCGVAEGIVDDFAEVRTWYVPPLAVVTVHTCWSAALCAPAVSAGRSLNSLVEVAEEIHAPLEVVPLRSELVVWGVYCTTEGMRKQVSKQMEGGQGKYGCY